MEALREPAAATFAQMCLETSYARHCAGHAKAVKALVSTIFHGLFEAAQGPETLRDEAQRLSLTLFRRDDPTAWFAEAYRRYKVDIRPERDYHKLRRMLAGQHILDYGCGSGLTAVRLAKGGYSVVMTDTLDYRSPEAFHLPFVPLPGSIELPFADGAFDTAIAYGVIHHIDGEKIPATLNELARVARQLLLVEDVYGVEAGHDLADCTIGGSYSGADTDDVLERYTALTRHQQYLALILLDFIPNIVVLGMTDMNMPYQFKTIDEWGHLLHASSLQIDHVYFPGFEAYRMHPSCRAWLLCSAQ